MKRLLLSFVYLFCILFVTQAQTKWFVTPGAPTIGTGTSWADPRDLQTAINTAVAGDSIFVAQGTYQLASGQSFSMKEGVKIYGRFAGTETTLSERNLKVTYASTLRGNNASVLANNNNGLSAAALLDGFTITNGMIARGGGIYNNYSSPTISNCIFTNNVGSAIYNSFSAATIINCVFENNTGSTTPVITAGAGGVDFINSNGGTIANCIFVGNSGYSAGAIEVNDFNTFNTATNIYNCTMYGNNATGSVYGSAGGVSFGQAYQSQVKNCIMWGNTVSGSKKSIDKTGGPVQEYRDLVNSNLIEGGYMANWDFNPQFINPANPIGPDNIWGTADDGLRLQVNSLAYNNGTPNITGLNIPGTDIAGNVRVQDGRIDMGAYEDAFACSASNILYVDASVTASGDGSSWATAFKSFYDAIVAAMQCAGKTNIFVAQGTYQPPVKSTYTMLPGVKMYGGFPSGGALFSQRNPRTYETILKANNNRVFLNYISGVDTTALLDGFTITGGICPGTVGTGNAAGAGIFNLNVSPSFNNCIITGNSTPATGGMGGGMCNSKSNAVMNHCTFINNTGATVNTIGGGGAIWNEDCTPSITYCNFINNHANYGAGVYNTYSIAAISNCIFVSNQAVNDGGAVVNVYGNVKIINSTFANNTAGSGGGAVDNWSAPLILTNTIFWNNSAGHDGDLWDETGGIQHDYNFFQTTRAGTGNITGTASPFLDVANPAGADGIWYTADDGLRLAPGSLCINTGTPDTTGLLIGNTDIAGTTRLASTAIDMGAYEYDNFPLPVTLVNFNGTLQNSVAALQWQSAEELDFKQFNVEKSTNGTQWMHVGEVRAKGSGSSYTYRVAQPEAVAYYRLKMVDVNGSITHSRLIRLTQQADNRLFIYPNPATNNINIQVAASGKMNVYTESGVLVKAVTVQAGINTIAISDLTAGVYYVRVNEQQAAFIKK